MHLVKKHFTSLKKNPHRDSQQQGQSHTEWQHWTVQYLLDMYKNKIACCKAAQCWNTEFQFSCCVKDTSIREEQSQEQRHSVPVSQRSVCTQTPIQTSLSHIIVVPGLPGSALWSQTDAWTLASTQIPQQTSASSSCEQPCNLPLSFSETKGC